MGRWSSSDFTTQKNAATNKPVWLFDVYWGDGVASGVLRMVADYHEDVIFDGETYRSDIPVEHSGLTEESGPRVAGATLVLGNADRTVEALLISCDGLRGQKVVVHKAFADAFFPEDSVSWEFQVDATSSDARQVVLELISRSGFLEFNVPARVFSNDLFPNVPGIMEVVV